MFIALTKPHVESFCGSHNAHLLSSQGLGLLIVSDPAPLRRVASLLGLSQGAIEVVLIQLYDLEHVRAIFEQLSECQAQDA